MSVSIATMGYYTPATGGTKIEYVEVGSSDGWWLRSKPQVVIRSVTEEDKYKKKPVIEITEVTNGNGKVI